jgi:uncharacterized protein (TIGR01244 family)
MNRLAIVLIAAILPISSTVYGEDSQPEPRKPAELEQTLKDDIPHVLCVEPNFTTGGQPSASAYAKLASNGFRSVLNLRTAQEGVNLEEEKSAVEKAGMRYLNIPVISGAPTPGQVTEFLTVVKDKSLQPMLIHCASANRVGAFWLIYRALDQGWPQEKALDEATRIGLTSPTLKKFALEYIASHQK